MDEYEKKFSRLQQLCCLTLSALEPTQETSPLTELRAKLEKEFGLEGHLMAGLIWELAIEKGQGDQEQIHQEYALLSKIVV